MVEKQELAPEVLILEAYEELRTKARKMTGRAPNTLAGTAGVNEVLMRIIKSRRTFPDRETFIAYCLVALRRAWLNQRSSGSRRGVRESLAVQGLLACIGDEAAAPRASETAEILELLRQLRRDRQVEGRKQVARAVEYHLLAGHSQAETARMIGSSKTQVQRWLAFFKSWASLAVDPVRKVVVRNIEALLDEPTVSDRARIAEVARRHYLVGEPRPQVARALGMEGERVDRFLRFFRSWAATNEAKRQALGEEDA